MKVVDINKFNFVWGEHRNHMSKAFKSQRENEDYCNISLVSSDGCVVRSHQAILASASGWFMKILNAANHDHPTVVLQDVSINHLKAILNYIYMGNIQMEQSMMNELLEIADSLELKGLCNIRRNSAMNKFLSTNSNEMDSKSECKQQPCNSPQGADYPPPPPSASHQVKGANEDGKRTIDPCGMSNNASSGLLFEDTPEGPTGEGDEEALPTSVTDHEKISSDNEDDTLNNANDGSDSLQPYSRASTARLDRATSDTEGSTNNGSLHSYLQQCSAIISSGVASSSLNASQLHHIDNPSLHSGYPTPTSVCFSQTLPSTSYNSRIVSSSAASSVAASVMQQSHTSYLPYSSPLLPSASKRDYEGRMLAPRVSPTVPSMIDYTSPHHLGLQQQQHLLSGGKTNSGTHELQDELMYSTAAHVDATQQGNSLLQQGGSNNSAASSGGQCIQQQQQRHIPQYQYHPHHHLLLQQQPLTSASSNGAVAAASQLPQHQVISYSSSNDCSGGSSTTTLHHPHHHHHQQHHPHLPPPSALLSMQQQPAADFNNTNYVCPGGEMAATGVASSLGSVRGAGGGCYQTAGIDLSLTKSEPSSPRDYTAAALPGAAGQLSQKRKRSDVTLDDVDLEEDDDEDEEMEEEDEDLSQSVAKQNRDGTKKKKSNISIDESIPSTLTGKNDGPTHGYASVTWHAAGSVGANTVVDNAIPYSASSITNVLKSNSAIITSTPIHPSNCGASSKTNNIVSSSSNSSSVKSCNSISTSQSNSHNNTSSSCLPHSYHDLPLMSVTSSSSASLSTDPSMSCSTADQQANHTQLEDEDDEDSEADNEEEEEDVVGDGCGVGLSSDALEINNSNSNDVDILSGDTDCLPQQTLGSSTTFSDVPPNGGKCRFTIEELAAEQITPNNEHQFIDRQNPDVELDGPDGRVLISLVENVENIPCVHRKLQIKSDKDVFEEQDFKTKNIIEDAENSTNQKTSGNSSGRTSTNAEDGPQKSSENKSKKVKTNRQLRRKAKLKRMEQRRQWLAEEKRTLFSGLELNRPLTRALEKLYSIQAAKNITTEVNKNCDIDCDSLNVDTVDCVNEGDINIDNNNIDCHNNTGKNIDVGSNADISVTCDTPFSSIVNGEVGGKNISLCIDSDNTVMNAQSDCKSKDSNNRVRNTKKFKRSLKKKATSLSPLTLFTMPPIKSKEKPTRKTLNLHEKVKVIESFLDGKSQRQIAIMNGIGKTQVSEIIKKREEVLSLYKSHVMKGEKITPKRNRRSEYALLNEHLIKWYRHMASGTRITTAMVRAKALQIAPQLGYHDFKASNGWFATFKNNNNLKFSRSKSSTKTEAEENDNNNAALRGAGMSGSAADDGSGGYFDDTEVDATEEEGATHQQLLNDGGHPGAIVNSVGGGGLRTGGVGPSGGVDTEVSSAPCAGGFLASPGLLQGAAAAILKCGVSVAGQSAATNLAPQLPMEAFHLSRPTGPMDHHNTGAPHHPHHHHHHPVHHSGSSLALAAAGKTDQTSSAAAAAAAAAGVLGYKSEEPLGYGGYDHHHHHQLAPRMTADQLPPRMTDQLSGRMPTDPASRMADQLPHRMPDPSRMTADQLAPRMTADQLSGRGMAGDQLTGRMGDVAGGGSSSAASAAAASSSAAAAAVAAAARTSEYNYAPYTFPSGYYGYHFLGQY